MTTNENSPAKNNGKMTAAELLKVRSNAVLQIINSSFGITEATRAELAAAIGAKFEPAELKFKL
jgi:plasmid maintenance system antidote protein VapI